jgi:hypothetical protein
MPTKSPYLPEGTDFDIYTLETVGGGGRAYQFAGLYDTNYRNSTFGDFFVRDSRSPVFPTNSPPITDGFGTWTVTVSTEERVDEILPAVPSVDAICQQNTVEILGTGSREKSSQYCFAKDNESLVYGRATGGLNSADFVYIFDFCPTGLRGGRDYLVWFSPIDTQGRFANCPFPCHPDAPYYGRSFFVHIYFCQRTLSPR